MSALLTSSRTKSRWESFRGDSTNGYGSPNQKVLDLVQAYYENNVDKNLTAVDIASGNGRYAIELAKMGYAVDAIEYADTGVQRISNEAEKIGLDIQVSQGDFTQICDEERQYDLVLSSGLLEEISMSHHADVIRGYQRRTKPGGLSIIKYCLEISGRGQLVEDDFVYTFYENDDREIIDYREKKEMKTSNATIDFDGTYDAMIRTGTVVAKKIQ